MNDFFSSADNRPSGKSPVGTVQEPPSKLPGKTGSMTHCLFYSMYAVLRGNFKMFDLYNR